jgi:sulfur carrier protein
MKVVLNGKELNLEAALTLEALLQRHDIFANTNGVAVAVNDSVVPRRQWPEVQLRDGDTIEVIHAVQGG